MKSVDQLRHLFPETEVQIFKINPSAVKIQTLQRIPALPLNVAHDIISILKQERLLDPASSMFTSDPRKNNWQTPLFSIIRENEMRIHRFEESLNEIFNMAYGIHEIASEHGDEIMKFFLRQP